MKSKSPRKEPSHIKKTTIRLPIELFEEFKKAAIDEQKSMSEIITILVKYFLKGHHVLDKLK